MDFSKQYILFAVLIGVITVCYCIEIRTEETSGTRNDGLIDHGANFSIHCSAPSKAGQVTAWYKRQTGMSPIVLGFGDFIMDPGSKHKFEGRSVQEGEELLEYVISLKERYGGAQYIDSGDYGCAIGSIPGDDDDHSQKDIRWVTLIVLDPIDSLDMYSVKKEDSHDPIGEHTRYVDGQEVKMEPGEELYLRCQARASNPPADIRVYHAKRDITAQYERKEIEVMVKSEDVPGSAANHHIAYDVTMTSKNPLKIDEEYNKRPLTCNASATGLKTVELTIMPVMLYHPKVECKDTAAVLDETKVTLKCRVRANPPIENARYEFNDGEEKKKIKVGEIVDSIYMKKEDGEYEDQYVYSLEFPSVKEEFFRAYTFQGENRLGEVKRDATLTQDPGSSAEGSGNVQKAWSTLTILSIVGLCLYL